MQRRRRRLTTKQILEIAYWLEDNVHRFRADKASSKSDLAKQINEKVFNGDDVADGGQVMHVISGSHRLSAADFVEECAPKPDPAMSDSQVLLEAVHQMRAAIESLGDRMKAIESSAKQDAYL